MPNDFNIDLDTINNLNENQTYTINRIIFNNSYEKCISLNEKDILSLEKKNATYGDSMTFAKFDGGNSAAFKIKQEVFFNDAEYEMYQYFEKYEWADSKFKQISANNLCPCGSNKKYKKCCRNKVERCKNILNQIHFQQNKLFINSKLGYEEPVQLSNYEHSELRNRFDFLKK